MPPKKKPRRVSKLPPQKQTITQMDPFRHQHHSDEDDPHSDAKISDPFPKPKKRKSMSTPVASTVQTRSAKKKAESDVQKALEGSPTRTQMPPSTVQKPHSSPLPESLDMTMPPPKTPTTVRRKVIPSSQSPAETPISTCKRSSRKTLDLTPLQERSVNTPSKSWAASRRKDVSWTPRLEVADSTDIENDDSQPLFPIVDPKHPKPIKRAPASQPPATEEEPPSKTPSAPPLADDVEITPREQHPRIDKSKEAVTIKDNDAMDAASQMSVSAVIDETPPSPTAAGSLSGLPRASVFGLPKRPDPEAIEHGNFLYSDDDQHNDSFETVPTQLLLQQPTRRPELGLNSTETPQRIQDSFQSLTSDEPATNLVPEISQFSSPLRAPHGPMLETESQFENAWRDFTPLPEYDGDTAGSDYESPPRISNHYEPSLSLSHQRTNNSSLIDLQSLPLIPPSQATTADQTQVSIRHTQAHPTPARKSRRQIPSSPTQQREALSSSSPFHTRKGRAADTYMGYQGWNGIPMTESQLLPDSLLNDNLGLPLIPDVGEEAGLHMEEY
ncbi:MAG: hypothetical protein Q9169_005637 [Polycauliona sp. 2 TL-2023]